MKLIQLPLKVVLCLIMVGFSIIPLSQASASSISVKLTNYIGNRSSIDFDTEGSYKLANNNTRYSGKDRFEVANNVASGGWNTASTVVVVNYMAFADALAAAPLAYKHDAPILLTKPNELPAEIESKIRALGATNIVIVGGPGSVSVNVENKLRSIAGNVERVGGIDRFEVAQLVAGKLGNPSSAIVTNGLVFSDALAIAPYAARNQIPILLTHNNKLPDSTRAALQGKSSTLVIGGEGSVNGAVYGQLAGPSRIGGKDRYEVSANIIKQLNLNAETVYLSNGLTFADALTGSVLAAKQNAPLLLTRPNELPGVVLDTIRERQTSIVNVLGGPASVSDHVVGSLPNEYLIQPGVRHNVRVENGRLSLYKGSQKVKDFGGSPFTLATSYSGSNKINIYGNAPRTYLGNMEFTLEGANVRPVNKDIPFEEYLKGVVPREMPASWGDTGGMEALKAQAIAARTYSIDDIGKAVWDSQAYQVYGGLDWDARTNAAVEATSGQVVRYNGKLVTALYSSSNGGVTASNTDEWGTAKLAYFNNAADPYDTAYTWKLDIQKNQISVDGQDMLNYGYWWWAVSEADQSLANHLKTWLSQNGFAGKDIRIAGINSFQVAPGRNATSNTATLAFDFYVYGMTDEAGLIKRQTAAMTRTLKDYRSMFGTVNFRSTFIDNVADADGKISINGKGFGHGVGLSQHGAYNRSKDGYTYKEILEFYYSGATVGN